MCAQPHINIKLTKALVAIILPLYIGTWIGCVCVCVWMRTKQQNKINIESLSRYIYYMYTRMGCFGCLGCHFYFQLNANSIDFIAFDSECFLLVFDIIYVLLVAKSNSTALFFCTQKVKNMVSNDMYGT